MHHHCFLPASSLQAAMDSRAEERLQLKRDFAEFLDADSGAGPYVAAINDLAQAAENGEPLRLHVDMNDLLDHDAALHNRLLNRPAVCLPPFQEALEEQLRWASRPAFEKPSARGCLHAHGLLQINSDA